MPAHSAVLFFNHRSERYEFMFSLFSSFKFSCLSPGLRISMLHQIKKYFGLFWKNRKKTLKRQESMEPLQGHLGGGGGVRVTGLSLAIF